MITPTVGRVVWFYPAGRAHTEQPNAAFITYVHSDSMINVGGFDYNGKPFGETSVLLVQGEGCYGNPGGGWKCNNERNDQETRARAGTANALGEKRANLQHRKAQRRS